MQPCDLCGGPINKAEYDHCHDDGLVRGLVCAYCNRGMHFIDKADWLAKALAYKADPPMRRHCEVEHLHLQRWWARRWHHRNPGRSAAWKAANTERVKAYTAAYNAKRRKAS